MKLIRSLQKKIFWKKGQTLHKCTSVYYWKDSNGNVDVRIGPLEDGAPKSRVKDAQCLQRRDPTPLPSDDWKEPDALDEAEAQKSHENEMKRRRLSPKVNQKVRDTLLLHRRKTPLSISEPSSTKEHTTRHGGLHEARCHPEPVAEEEHHDLHTDEDTNSESSSKDELNVSGAPSPPVAASSPTREDPATAPLPGWKGSLPDDEVCGEQAAPKQELPRQDENYDLSRNEREQRVRQRPSSNGLSGDSQYPWSRLQETQGCSHNNATDPGVVRSNLPPVPCGGSSSTSRNGGGGYGDAKSTGEKNSDSKMEAQEDNFTADGSEVIWFWCLFILFPELPAVNQLWLDLLHYIIPQFFLVFHLSAPCAFYCGKELTYMYLNIFLCLEPHLGASSTAMIFLDTWILGLPVCFIPSRETVQLWSYMNHSCFGTLELLQICHLITSYISSSGKRGFMSTKAAGRKNSSRNCLEPPIQVLSTYQDPRQGVKMLPHKACLGESVREAMSAFATEKHPLASHQGEVSSIQKSQEASSGAEEKIDDPASSDSTEAVHPQSNAILTALNVPGTHGQRKRMAHSEMRGVAEKETRSETEGTASSRQDSPLAEAEAENLQGCSHNDATDPGVVSSNLPPVQCGGSSSTSRGGGSGCGDAKSRGEKNSDSKMEAHSEMQGVAEKETRSETEGTAASRQVPPSGEAENWRGLDMENALADATHQGPEPGSENENGSPDKPQRKGRRMRSRDEEPSFRVAPSECLDSLSVQETKSSSRKDVSNKILNVEAKGCAILERLSVDEIVIYSLDNSKKKFDIELEISLRDRQSQLKGRKACPLAESICKSEASTPTDHVEKGEHEGTKDQPKKNRRIAARENSSVVPLTELSSRLIEPVRNERRSAIYSTRLTPAVPKVSPGRRVAKRQRSHSKALNWRRRGKCQKAKLRCRRVKAEQEISIAKGRRSQNTTENPRKSKVNNPEQSKSSDSRENSAEIVGSNTYYHEGSSRKDPEVHNLEDPGSSNTGGGNIEDPADSNTGGSNTKDLEGTNTGGGTTENPGGGDVGSANTGGRNTRDSNTGGGNAGQGTTEDPGDSNTGNSNTGEGNTENPGGGNTGGANTGDSNTGDGNTGDSNAGQGTTEDPGGSNTGDSNTGEGNTEDPGGSNTGGANTGDSNTGEGSTGDSDTGEGNTEDLGGGITGGSNTGEGNTEDPGGSNTGDSNTGEGSTGGSNTGEGSTEDPGGGTTGGTNTGDSSTGEGNTEDPRGANTGCSSIGYINTGDSSNGEGNTEDLGGGSTGGGNAEDVGGGNTEGNNTEDPGGGNTGDSNTGDSNTGDSSTGDSNTGGANSVGGNTGDRNTEEGNPDNPGDGDTGDSSIRESITEDPGGNNTEDPGGANAENSGGTSTDDAGGSNIENPEQSTTRDPRENNAEYLGGNSTKDPEGSNIEEPGGNNPEGYSGENRSNDMKKNSSLSSLEQLLQNPHRGPLEQPGESPAGSHGRESQVQEESVVLGAEGGLAFPPERMNPTAAHPHEETVPSLQDSLSSCVQDIKRYLKGAGRSLSRMRSFWHNPTLDSNSCEGPLQEQERQVDRLNGDVLLHERHRLNFTRQEGGVQPQVGLPERSPPLPRDVRGGDSAAMAPSGSEGRQDSARRFLAERATENRQYLDLHQRQPPPQRPRRPPDPDISLDPDPPSSDSDTDNDDE